MRGGLIARSEVELPDAVFDRGAAVQQRIGSDEKRASALLDQGREAGSKSLSTLAFKRRTCRSRITAGASTSSLCFRSRDFWDSRAQRSPLPWLLSLPISVSVWA